MADRDFAVEGGHGAGEGGGGIALDNDVVGFFLFEDRVEAFDDFGAEGVEGLAWGHRGQIVVGLDVEELEEGGEEVGVLAGVDDDGVAALASDLMDEGSHFDHFGPGSEAEEDARGGGGGRKLNNHNNNKSLLLLQIKQKCEIYY
jgi:hypothetical protein